ncbi:protein kinase [Paludisphaera sp.]|uniref:protein kinase domain-containing protein n=1 Tax=Paludisphaera sp. TaxID=2017432 RepID=UPI00301D1803
MKAAMADRDPTLQEPRRSEGRAACSNCSRVLIFSGDPPRFCGYCGAALSPDSVTDSGGGEETIAAGSTVGMPTVGETAEYVPGKSRSTPDEGAFPDRVAGYHLRRRLGSGGMGTVFEAFDEQQGRNVAVKLIAPRNLDSDQALDRFRLEGRTAAAVTHPRCVFVHAVDEESGLPYIVMELMPGDTLQSLVEGRGPLPPAVAIPKILDVMEGLAEFHRLGMIHRDVKPSNCFLDEGGRVKIGDFGLSKSMEGGADLTRTGAFLGTPLYASPEQIKRETLDERTDVYSVAATLYFLLTGRPPVRARDAAEALARIVSEPPPPVREFAPGVPRALEAAILRGLDRDRSRRWRDLREFHEALLPFLPERVDIGSIGLRVGAYLVDLTLFHVATWAAIALVFFLHRGRALETMGFMERHGWTIELAATAGWIGYFTVLEGLLASSVGKWLVGLRVSRMEVGDPPGLRRALVRTLAFVLLAGLGSVAWHGLVSSQTRVMDMLIPSPRLAALNLVGLMILAAPMRQPTGFRGMHELASGTRVVRVVPARGVRRLHASRGFRAGRRRDRGAGARAPEVVETFQVGPYVVDGSIATTHGRRVFAGHDGALGRRAWLVLRDSGSTPPDPRRCALDRLTRPRWIGGGDLPDSRWDAFTAPAGRPFRDLAGHGGLAWRDLLPILLQLAEELEAARGDGTFPDSLSLDDVWVQEDGRVQLVDPLDWGRPAPGDAPAAADGEEPRALALLADVARAGLGAARPGGRIRRAVPRHAREMLDRLLGDRPAYARLAHLRADLIAAASRPTEVGVARRGLQLAIQAVLMTPTLLLLVGFSCPELDPDLMPWDMEIMAAIPVIWLAWSFLARGGISYRLAGLCLVGPDGRVAGRFVCAFRALLAWSIPVGLLLASESIQDHAPEAIASAWSLWLAGVFALLAALAVALIFPGRGPHDAIAGTAVVPI